MSALKRGLLSVGFVISHIFGFSASAQDTTAAPKVTAPGLVTDMRYYDAVKARLKGDDKEAERLLQQVVTEKPDAAGAYYDLARLYFKRNNPDKAIEYIKKAISIDDSNPWYKSQYAEILVLANRQDEAAAAYTELAKHQKYNRDYLVKAIHLYIYKNKLKEAMGVLDTLLVKEPDNEELQNEKVELYLKMNDVQGAVRAVQSLIDKNPMEGKYYASLAEIYENNKMPGKADEIYHKIENDFGDDPLVQLSLAEYYKKRENFERYDEFARKAITNKALDADAQINIFASYWQERSKDTSKRKALEEITKEVAAQHPNNATVLAIYAQMLALNNKTTESLEYYKKSVGVDPSQYSVWLNLLSEYTDKHNADSLIKYSEKALRLFPNQAMLHYLNGVGYMNKGGYDKAAKSVSRAIDMEPEGNNRQLVQMYTLLGDVYNFDKKYALSDSSYEKALKLDPDDATLLNNYSYYLSVRGVRLEDAERMSKKSLEIRKNEPTFLDTYGWILYKQGKYDKALEYLQKAVADTGHTDGTVWEHLGDTYYKLSDVDKAVDCWKKAKEKGTDNTDIEKKIKDRKLYES